MLLSQSLRHSAEENTLLVNDGLMIFCLWRCFTDSSNHSLHPTCFEGILFPPSSLGMLPQARSICLTSRLWSAELLHPVPPSDLINFEENTGGPPQTGGPLLNTEYCRYWILKTPQTVGPLAHLFSRRECAGRQSWWRWSLSCEASKVSQSCGRLPASCVWES